jgi:hypothetical protein
MKTVMREVQNIGGSGLSLFWEGTRGIAAKITLAPSLKVVLINKAVITAVTLSRLQNDGKSLNRNTYVIYSSQFILKRVRFPMRSFDFSIDLILPAAL